MKCPRFLRSLLVPLLFSTLPLTAQVAVDPVAVDAVPVDPVPIDPPCPVFRSSDVTEEAAHQDVKLYFPWSLGVDEATLGDGDIVARGPNGYLQRAGLVSVERLPLPFPVVTTGPSVDGIEPVPLPQPHPILVATYRFLPPDGSGDTWTADDNGTYGVRLVEEEIANLNGRFLPPKFLGAFKVRIRPGPGVPVQPDEVRCKIRRAAVFGDDLNTPEIAYFAAVRMFFANPHVEIDWGNVSRSGNTLTANATAVRSPLPVPAPTMLTTADGVNAVDEVLRPSFFHRYRLGLLDPGTWTFVLKVNDVEECVKTFTIPPDPPIDDDPPEAELAVRDIVSPGHEPQRFVVTYKDRSGVDPSTIGDGDLVVFSPCAFHDLAEPVPCGWRAKRARFVEILAVSTHNREIKALYEINAPVNGWNANHNGFYPVVLWDDAVCDRLGNCVDRQRLGGFEVRIDPGDPPIPAEAEIRVDPGNPDRVVAKVHIDFKEHWEVVSQDIRRDGNRIFLEGKAEPLAVPAIFPPPPPPQQDLLYEIGPLRAGTYAAIYVMNGHVYDVKRFEVVREPPIPAEVTLAVDSSDPDRVMADVTIQFRTPHRVVQGEVERNGHRINLPARAEPLPLPADLSVVPPIPAPVHLRYEIGSLPPGGYIAFFEMNDFIYTAEDFKIDDPGPPIPAEVALRIDRSDPDEVTAVVRIRFETPHVIVDRDLHRQGNRFILEATAAPILTVAPNDAFAPVPLPEVVTLRYPLGELEPGQYGAAFVMNGWKYASETFEIEPPVFEADVALSVEERDDGHWIATAEIKFRNPQVRIIDPGEPVIDGHIIMINPTAELSDTTDAPPVPFVLRYDLGELEHGPWWLKYFINGHFEQQLDFHVPPPPPIPATAEIAVDTSSQPVHAGVTIRFRDHYRITAQSVQRFGNIFLLDATAEGPLPILAPIPPPPVELDYELGELPEGIYFAAFRMNGWFYDVEAFRIHDGGFEAEVDLAVDVGDEVTVKATVDIDDPYVIITDPGTPVFDGNSIRINATAERVNFIQEPSGDPMEFEYPLGALDPGRYELVYAINGEPEARTLFVVPPPCHPLPHVTDIRIAQGDVSWFSEVFVALFPNQRVTDWGEVRQSGNEFHVNVTVECVDFAPSPVPPVIIGPDDVELPEGMAFDAAGDVSIHGVPVRLVSHTYVLGVLDPGDYGFFVHSRGVTVARKAFSVPGTAPRVELSAGKITEETDEYRFGINYHDPDGLDHESIMGADVYVVGRDGYREKARLLSYASTDDVPSTGASARYAVNGPGGSWDFEDNGRYRVWVDPDAIRDLHGTTIENGWIGGFKVRIAPPPPEPGVNVSVAPNASGSWEATVEIISEPGEQVVVDAWGPVIHHGQVFVALASVHIEPTSGPVEPVAHVYDLGMLQPGDYLFVFKTNLAHCGIASFNVAGMEGDPVDNWAARAGLADAGGDEALMGYFFALDPTGDGLPRVRPEIVTGEDGRRHLGLRFRRLHGGDGVRQVVEGTRDLVNWVDVSDEIDLMERDVDPDGTEEVVLCLRAALEDTDLNYLRIRLDRESE